MKMVKYINSNHKKYASFTLESSMNFTTSFEDVLVNKKIMILKDYLLAYPGYHAIMRKHKIGIHIGTQPVYPQISIFRFHKGVYWEDDLNALLG